MGEPPSIMITFSISCRNTYFVCFKETSRLTFCLIEPVFKHPKCCFDRIVVNLKGTATLMIRMNNQNELYEP